MHAIGLQVLQWAVHYGARTGQDRAVKVQPRAKGLAAHTAAGLSIIASIGGLHQHLIGRPLPSVPQVTRSPDSSHGSMPQGPRAAAGTTASVNHSAAGVTCMDQRAPHRQCGPHMGSAGPTCMDQRAPHAWTSGPHMGSAGPTWAARAPPSHPPLPRGPLAPAAPSAACAAAPAAPSVAGSPCRWWR